MTDPDVKVAQPVLLRCLMLSRDGICINHVREAAKEIGLSIEACRDAVALEAILAKQKFEAVIIDLSCGPDAYQGLHLVRHSPANKTAAILTVAGANQVADAFMKGSNFILEKPLTRDSILRIFKVAYGWMVRERRRYFRCPVTIPIFATQNGKSIACQSVNISEGGMAVVIQNGFHPDARIDLSFRFSERQPECQIEAITRWHKMGISGLQFISMTSETRAEVNTFLSQKLEGLLPKSLHGAGL